MAKSCLKPVCCLLLWLAATPAWAQGIVPEALGFQSRLARCRNPEQMDILSRSAQRARRRPPTATADVPATPEALAYKLVVLCMVDVAEDAATEGVECSDRNAIWREVVRLLGDYPGLEQPNPDILRAYREISQCEEEDRISRAVEQVISESSVLSFLPSMLEQIGVKDLVPIINEMQSKPNKTPLDYLTIAELLAVSGESGGGSHEQIHAYVDSALARSSAPKTYYKAGMALWSAGDVDHAREKFRQGLERPQVHASFLVLYVGSLVWPLPFLLVCIGLIWSAAFVGYQRNARPLQMIDEAGGTKRGSAAQVFLGVVVGTTTMAAYGFYRNGHIAAFAILAGGAIASAIWFASLPIRDQIQAVSHRIWRWLGRLLSGRLFVPLIARIPHQWQLVILVATLVFFFFVYPALPEGQEGSILYHLRDYRLILFVLAAVLLFVTVGSIILGMLRRSGSLRRSLWWLAAVGSIPFLVFYLAVEWPALVDPLSRRILPSAATINRVASYVIVWLVGAGLASTMGRIVARSIIDPVRRINTAVAAVRGGDFDARTEVDRRDEIGTLALAVDDMAAGLAQRERIKKTLSRFVDPKVAQRLIDEDTLVMRGRTLHATVMFVDIRSFTPLSERLSPESVVDLLNRYFATIDPIVRKWGGLVDKFIGDGMLAVWGVPEPPYGALAGIPGERLATEAAVEMLEAIEELNRWLVDHALPDIRVGIGINSGPVIAGPIGSEDRQEYTVVGDVVNTAQRTEAAARGDNPLLVTGEVAEALGETAELEEIESVPLKGKHLAIRLYRVVKLAKRLPTPPA